ncbi:MAG TPA: alpha/beta hydrolase [Actinomycetes bacterium]|nr:alpha/beta hydrolase [Actinomycetes bacterium]
MTNDRSLELWPSPPALIAGLRVCAGGSTGPVLLLVPGLGATAEVWTGVAAMAERRWAGRWIVADLPGHGGSDRSASGEYTFAGMAAALADAVTEVAPGEPVTVLGHSLGGVLALQLAATRPAPFPVVQVIGVGIKVAWTDAELERAAALADRPPGVFGTQAAAIDRHLRVSGLAGLIPPDDPRLAPGVRETDQGWELALDPRTFAVGAPPMSELIAAAGCPVTLAAGEHDHMVTMEHLRALVPDPVRLDGLGHNAHVEDPATIWALLADRATGPGSAVRS